MIPLLALLLVPFLLRSMELTDAPAEESFDKFDELPSEMVSAHILKHATPSSLLLLSMTSKKFHDLAEGELYLRCAEDYCEIFGENNCNLYENGPNFCSPKAFLVRVWPKSGISYVSSYLTWMFKALSEPFDGDNSHISCESQKHLTGTSKVTKTILKMNILLGVELNEVMLLEVPWKCISAYLAGNPTKIKFKQTLHTVILSLLSNGHFDIVQSIIDDESIIHLIEPFMPFSIGFMKHLVSTKSVEDTVKEISPYGNMRGSGPLFEDFFASSGLSFNSLVDIFNDGWPFANGIREDLLVLLLRTGHNPDLAWFENSKLFDQNQIDDIKSCLDQKDCARLGDEAFSTALYYLVMKCHLDGKSLEEAQEEIVFLTGDRPFMPSNALMKYCHFFWKNSANDLGEVPEECTFRPFIGFTAFRSFPKKAEELFNLYHEAKINTEDFKLNLEDLIFEMASESVVYEVLELFEYLIRTAYDFDLIETIQGREVMVDVTLSDLLARKSLEQLVHLMPTIKTFDSSDQKLELTLSALLRKEGGIQALREYGITPFPVFLRGNFFNVTQLDFYVKLDEMLEDEDPEIFVLIDHYLFSTECPFNFECLRDGKKQNRLRLDAILTKATALYPPCLQMESIKIMGIDKYNLLSMYMIIALMSAAEGREISYGLVSEEDLQTAIETCNEFVRR